jgi:tetratricopeptide (TPR) repeat protein
MIWRSPIPARSGAVNGRAGRPGAGVFIAAQQQFEALGEQGARMASVTLAEQADCLQALGQLEAAAEKYEEAINEAENLEDFRQVAVGKGQLATVRMDQGRYDEAIAGHEAARTLFEQQNEPQMVAVAWHQIGMVYQRRGSSTRRKPPTAGPWRLKRRSGDRCRAGE